MKQAKRSAIVSAAVLLAAVVLFSPIAALAGAPILSGVNPTLTPAIAEGNANPPGYVVSSFLNPIVTDGTLLDDFEDGDNVSKWGGQWFTFNDAGSGGLSAITPFPFTPAAGGYNNSAYCGRIVVALHKNTMTYNPYVGLGVDLNPTVATPPPTVDLTKATGFRYWYKGSKHYFKVETSDINTGVQSNYQDSMPESATWKLATFTWDSLHTLVFATGAVNPVLASSKALANILSWVIQGADGYADSLFIDSVVVTGFGDRGIAVTGANNANGAWQYSIVTGTWTPFGTLNDNSATLLNAAALVRFVPAATYIGTSTFIFRAWNQTDNLANGTTGVNVSINGGVTAYSSVSATATVQVQNSNAPVITVQPAATTSVNEGGSLSLTVTATKATAYQWKKAGVAIAGATTATYTKNPVIPADSGSYTVMVKNATDSVESQAAIVTVTAKPANATVAPANETVLAGGSATFTVTVGTGTAPFTFQWLLNGVAVVPAQTGQSITISSAAAANVGTYTVTVTNSAGTTLSSPAQLVVILPVKALFTVSKTIGQIPDTVQFTDQSTGSFTKRLWYFGDSTVDSTNNQNPLHIYNSSSLDSVKLVLLNGAVRVDSITITITAFKDNPVTITGRYVSSGKAEITFANYASIPLGPLPLPYADSVRLSYMSGGIPTWAPPGAVCGIYLLSDMQKATPPFKADVSVSLAGADTVVGFMTQMHWYTGAAPFWSAPGNGTIVVMKDTATPVNTAGIAGTYLGGDSVLFSITNLLSLDSTSVDSVIIWFATSTADSTPNFADSAQTRRFKLSSILNNNGRDSVTVGNPLFNTGVQKLLYCFVVVKGKNTKMSAPVRAAYLAGKNRPSNPIVLTATTRSASSILLSWHPVGGITNINIWYQAGASVPVNTADFLSPPFNLVSVPSISDTTFTVTGLLAQTHYYFGAQVYQAGLWSYVTDSSSANATTYPAGAKLDTNSVKITSLTFDTVANQIHVSWKVNYNPLSLDTLQVGISYSVSGYPAADTSVRQEVLIKSGADSAIVTLHEPLVFSSDSAHPTYYYVALWESRLNGTPADPTAASRDSVASPFYNWQSVTFFTKVPGDTHSVFNGSIVVIANALSLGDVSNTNATIRYASNLGNLNGFVPVSVPFYFSHLDQCAPFKIEFKLFQSAATYGLANVRVYQQINGLWYVDRTSMADASGYAWTVTADATPQYPLMALIDTMPATVTRGLHADTVGAWTNLFDTLHISDNCANVTWKYLYANGDNSLAGADGNTLADTSAAIPVTISGVFVSPYTGLRARVVVNDGVNADTLNASRQVRRDSSDFVRTPVETWAPLRVTAAINNDTMKNILMSSAGNPAWTYDNKQLRLFRWYPDQNDLDSESNWVEFSDKTAGIFSMSPGIVVWAKSRLSIPVNFGPGVTPTVKYAYPILIAAGNWTDFALPFRFDVKIGDIIDSTGPGADSLRFYSWVRDTAGGRFFLNKLFLKDLSSVGLADMDTVLSSQDLVAYSVYNPTAFPVTLRIPPVPQSMSGYVSKRAANANKGWAVSVIPRLSDGSHLSPVLCGFVQAKGAATSYFPVPPSFAQEYAGVLDDTEKKVHGDALSHATADGGYTYLLAFSNDGQEQSRISYHLEPLGVFPKGCIAKTLNENTGQYDDFSAGDAAVSVAAGGREYRLLVVGSESFLAKTALVMRAGTLQFIGTSPNPFGSFVRIRYAIPRAGVSSVTFSIYDMRGRMVWRKTTAEGGFPGMREITWDGMSLDKRPVAAGMYVVRMAALDANMKTGGVFEKRMTYLP